jgi:glycosyltransferase involved in cell wall biosynthesis
LLIKAVDQGKKNGLDIELNIAGDGNMRTKLENLANEISVADRVNFLGRIDPEKMPEVYRENHIFIMSSAHEGMSNAMLEAMASGLPIVTTRCEGVDELVEDNGIVVDRADARSIADAIKSLVEDEHLYQRMCAKARQRAENFTWTAVADKYIECYRTVVGGTIKEN